MTEVHICPILMRTVIWEEGKCKEKCTDIECPIAVEAERTSGGRKT